MTVAVGELKAQYDSPWEAVADEREQRKELEETVEAQAETIEEQDERIEELKAQSENELIEVKSDGDNAGLMDIWIAGIPLGSILQKTTENVDSAQTRIDELEEATTTNETPGVATGKMETQDGHTPMERICALPEHMVDKELSANQRRARFIASDLRDYAEKAPAGYVIDSRTITKVITAAEGKKPHTQTVARIMDFLNDLGKDEIELKKRQSRKLVVIDEAAADRYHARCDRAEGTATNLSVIAGP